MDVQQNGTTWDEGEEHFLYSLQVALMQREMVILNVKNLYY